MQVDLHVGINQRKRPDDHAGPEGDLEDADAVGDFLVAPFGQPAVDLVQLAVDARLDFIELLVDVGVGGLFDAAGDAGGAVCATRSALADVAVAPACCDGRN